MGAWTSLSKGRGQGHSRALWNAFANDIIHDRWCGKRHGHGVGQGHPWRSSVDVASSPMKKRRTGWRGLQAGRPVADRVTPRGGGGFWRCPPPPARPYEVLWTWGLTHSTPLARETREPPTCLCWISGGGGAGGVGSGGAVELLKSHTKNAPQSRSFGARTAARSATPHASSEGIWRGGCSAPPVPVGSEGSLSGWAGGFNGRGRAHERAPPLSPTDRRTVAQTVWLKLQPERLAGWLERRKLWLKESHGRRILGQRTDPRLGSKAWAGRSVRSEMGPAQPRSVGGGLTIPLCGP